MKLKLFIIFLLPFKLFADFSGTWSGHGKYFLRENNITLSYDCLFNKKIDQSDTHIDINQDDMNCGVIKTSLLKPIRLFIHGNYLIHKNKIVGQISDNSIKLKVRTAKSLTQSEIKILGPGVISFMEKRKEGVLHPKVFMKTSRLKTTLESFTQ